MNKVIISLLIIIVCAVSLGLLQHIGISTRKEGKAFSLAHERFPVYVVQKTVDVVSLWNEKQVHGRIVVHLGKFLHFMKSGAASGGVQGPMQINTGTRYEDIVEGDSSHYNNNSPDRLNFLWVAMQKNIARGIYNVIPPPDFMKRFGLTDPAAAQKDIVEHEFGSPRVVTTRLPSISEPVLLNIDASFFASTDPAQILDVLLKANLSSDIVTICLAEDNPDVTDFERKRLHDFIGLLREHVGIINFITPTTGLSTVTK